jgi:hypothetical protein
MDFRILGPLEALDEGRVVALGGSKQRALLAFLLLHANETLSTDRLIDELWGERAPANAAKTVQILHRKSGSQPQLSFDPLEIAGMLRALAIFADSACRCRSIHRSASSSPKLPMRGLVSQR